LIRGSGGGGTGGCGSGSAAGRLAAPVQTRGGGSGRGGGGRAAGEAPLPLTLRCRASARGGRSADEDDGGDSLSATCPLPLHLPTAAGLPYSEASRRYRRTVFSHEDWLEHRSNTRLFGNLSGLLTSGWARGPTEGQILLVLVTS